MGLSLSSLFGTEQPSSRLNADGDGQLNLTTKEINILWVRHDYSCANHKQSTGKLGRVQKAFFKDPYLSQIGVYQAYYLNLYLTTQTNLFENVSAFYVSRLFRTAETAAFTLAGLSTPTSVNKITMLPYISEKGLGLDNSPLSADDNLERYNTFFGEKKLSNTLKKLCNTKKLHKTFEDKKFPNLDIETYKDHLKDKNKITDIKGFIEFLPELIQSRNNGDTIVIFSHSAFIKKYFETRTNATYKYEAKLPNSGIVKETVIYRPTSEPIIAKLLPASVQIIYPEIPIDTNYRGKGLNIVPAIPYYIGIPFQPFSEPRIIIGGNNKHSSTLIIVQMNKFYHKKLTGETETDWKDVPEYQKKLIYKVAGTDFVTKNDDSDNDDSDNSSSESKGGDDENNASDSNESVKYKLNQNKKDNIIIISMKSLAKNSKYKCVYDGLCKATATDFKQPTVSVGMTGMNITTIAPAAGGTKRRRKTVVRKKRPTKTKKQTKRKSK